jgi:aspartyl-tRNA(Asn)/glutamyl-tRNA(Gln) amidotransferase subunit A
MSDAAELTIAEAIAKKVSPKEMLDACKARIEKWQPKINAFVSQEVLHSGKSEGPLRGVPLAHKDMFYRPGKVTNCGSKIRKGWVANDLSAALEGLDRAGAAHIGTLNMSEFAYNPTGHNEHWGDCKNPWKTDSITGGSSSGSGAAVAARCVYGALGSDTGGSVRLPAAANGVTGLKTTWGRVSRHGALPLSHSLDTIGPLARSAEDCALMLQAIAGHDERDAVSARKEVPDYVAQLKTKKPRIGISRAWIEQNSHPEVAKALLDAAKTFDLVETEIPDFEALSAHCLVVMQAEASAQHAQWMRTRSQDYGSGTRARLETGYAIPAPMYLESLRLRHAWLEEFTKKTLGNCDAYFVPAIKVPIPTREATGPQGGPGTGKLLAEVTYLTRWVNYLGVPAIVAPVGFDSNGLPIAMQLVGCPFSEATLLAAVHAYQRETDWHRRSPQG